MANGKRRPSRPEKHEINTAFDQLINDFEHGRVSRISLDAVRPAYAYTSQCSKEGWRSAAAHGKLKATPEEENEKSTKNNVH